MKNIYKYSRRIKNLFLIFGGGSKLKVEGYTDLNFMFDVDDRRSTGGVFFYVANDQLARRVSSSRSLQIRP